MIVIAIVSEILIFLAGVSFFFMQSPDTPRATLGLSTAHEFVNAWAQFERCDTADIRENPDGDFFGTVGSVAFDYIASAKKLTALATVHPQAARLLKRNDVMVELRRVEREDPKSVDYAHFSLVVGRWQKKPWSEPWLYLKTEFSDPQPVNVVVQRLNSLSDTAHLWFRVRFGDLLDRVNRERVLIP